MVLQMHELENIGVASHNNKNTGRQVYS